MLPKGWKSIALSEIQTKTPSIDPKRYPTEVFDLFSVPSYTSYAPECVTGDKIGSVKQEIQNNDILLCKIVPHIRRAWAVPQRAQRRQIASGEWIVFRSDYINSQYLKNFLISDGFHEQFMHTVSGVGGSLMRARPSEAVKILFPLPPLAEQRRIVAKLDSLTARIARARAELERTLIMIATLKHQTLKSVFSIGQKKPRLFDSFSNFGSFQLGKMLDKAKNIGDNENYLRNINVRWGHIDTSDMLRMPFTEKEKSLFSLKKGDVLICEGGEPGRAAIWDKDDNDIYFQKALHRFRSNGSILPEIVILYLKNISITGELANNFTGSTIKHLPQIKLKKIPFPIISQKDQSKIVLYIRNSFGRADQLATEVQRALALLDRLEASLLTKAFRGELVPQDPNDEPASLLIDRIRAERAADTKPKRGRKQSTQDMSLPRKRQTEKHD